MRWFKIVSITIICTLVIVGSYYPFSPGAQQRKNMALARQHLPQVLHLLKADSRFSYVTASDFTGEGGSLAVGGAVRSEHDLADLKQQVELTSPPVKVVWQVKVYPPPLFDDVVK